MRADILRLIIVAGASLLAIAAAKPLPTPPGAPGQPAATAPADAPVFEQQGIRYRVVNVARSPDRSSVNITLEITNVSRQPLYTIWVQPPPSIYDQLANEMWLEAIAGHDQCSWEAGWFNLVPDECWLRQSQRYTVLGPGAPSLVTLTFRRWENGRGSATIDGDSITLTGRLIVTAGEQRYDIISLSIPVIPIN
jgi:hypothetical protein